MSNNLDLYNKVRQVPDTAKKPIQGGRLKGMTDINPMWRIKTLTEQFGACGVGWYYDITSKTIEEGGNDEKVAFVDIDLFVKYGDEWSMPIQGTGGSSFISKERNGLYTNDECFKMALTDALGVAMKSLGIGADVYFEKDRSKYDTPPGEPQPQKSKPQEPSRMDKDNTNDNSLKCSDCDADITPAVKTYSEKNLGKPLCFDCQKKYKQEGD